MCVSRQQKSLKALRVAAPCICYVLLHMALIHLAHPFICVLLISRTLLYCQNILAPSDGADIRIPWQDAEPLCAYGASIQYIDELLQLFNSTVAGGGSDAHALQGVAVDGGVFAVPVVGLQVFNDVGATRSDTCVKQVGERNNHVGRHVAAVIHHHMVGSQGTETFQGTRIGL